MTLRRTLRARLTFLSAAGLAVGLAIGGLLIVGVLHLVLIRSVDSTTRQTSHDVNALLTTGRLSTPIPTAGESIVQVIDAQRRVLDVSVGADMLVPLLTPAELTRALGGEVVVLPGDRADVDGELRVIARRAIEADPDNDNDGGPRVIIVAASTHAVEESTETVRNALLIAYPLLLAALTALAWRVVGATLRPVEVLRAGADQISGGGVVASLPVPPGDDEVHRLAVTLNDMLDRLDTARRRQRAFVADAAHELRSPIASLRTQLEVAGRLDESPPIADLLTDVSRLGLLVDDLLLLARVDEGDPRLLTVESVDLSALALSVADGYANAPVLVSASAVGPVWTVGQPTALRRVLANLVANAVRHASHEVKIKSETIDATWVRVTVSDDGPGIPAADRERVFDRFTRLDDARNRDEGGAGLGLAIVRELLRAHHGTITLDDAEPGLRVEVTLPAGAPSP